MEKFSANMNTPFYLLQGTIFRTQENLNDLIEIDEVFYAENLINARQKAFQRFQSYLDVFLDSIGHPYQSYEDAIETLADFVNSYKLEYAAKNIDLGRLDTDFDKGLFLYLVTDPSDTFTTKEGTLIYNQKYLLHFFNNNFNNYWRPVFNDLKDEYWFYKTHNYTFENQSCKINTGKQFDKKKIVDILQSPINFQKLIDQELN